MPSKKLSSILGGGVFRTEIFVFNQAIASGQTGDLVTIGTAGKVTRLTMLITNGAATQTGISIDSDGATIVGPSPLSEQATPSGGSFFVAPAVGVSASVIDAGGSILDVFGEFITIKKDGGNTSNELRYSYEIGSIS